MRMRLLLLTVPLLLLAACGADGDDTTADDGDDPDGGDVEVTVEDEDGDETTVRSEETDDGTSTEVETDDGTVGMDTESLPDEWPEEWPVPEEVSVANMLSLDEDGTLTIQGMLAHDGNVDDAVAYIVGLEDEGWDAVVDEEDVEVTGGPTVELEGFGWDATVDIFEAPNPGMNVTLTER